MPYCQFKSNEAFSSFGSLCLRELNYNLVSCSKDGAIKIFDLDTFQCIKSLQVSKVKVSCLEVNSIYQQLIVIAEERFVKIYDLINFNFIDTINVYSESNFSRIRCIKMLSSNEFALGSCTEILIWDLQTKNLYKNLECPGVICLEILDNSRIFTGLWDAGGIKLWDLNKLTCVQTFLGHSSDVTCLCLMNGNGNLTLVSGSNDKTIKIWSLDPIEKSACLKTLIGHSNSVTKLEIAFNKFDLISCSCDGTIKIWNRRV
jgi:WD40 repeat protein